MLLKNKYVHMSACMLVLLFCVLVARPFVPMGINDDWSYIWTARVLADTGHLVYNGWATAILGWQIYFGALFIKLFGFSFTIVRSSVLVVSLLCAALMQRVFARLGVGEWTATIATLTLVLSPVFLPLSCTFMTDVPGLFVLVLCIYCCLRALQSTSDKAALGWLVCAAFSNMAGGTVRQIAWLGALVIVPSAAWYMRRRRHILPAGAALWILSVLCIALCMRWFRLQPYANNEKILFRYHKVSIIFAANPSVVALVLLLPIMSAFLVTYPAGKRRAHHIAAIAGAAFGAIFFWWAVKSSITFFSKGVAAGILLGAPPDGFPIIARFLLTAFTFSALACFLVCVFNEPDESLPAETHTTSAPLAYPYLPNTALITLLAPFTVASVVLILTRIIVYDRYFLPLLFVSTLCLIRVYTQAISNRLPRLCLIVGLAYAAYGVASMHDVFAFARARLDAADKITATGVPRIQIQAGFEYDAWTQLEQTGYVNDPRIVNPPGAYHQRVPPPDTPISCIGWFASYTPSVNPLLALSFTPDNSCYRPSRFAPIIYQTWLPPRQRTIYILDRR